jgi:Zn-dependent protease with chaperone function
VTYELRFVVIVLAAFAWSSLAASALVPRLARRLSTDDPARLATKLWRLRTAPAGVGLLVAAVAATSYLFFEPHDNTDERTGLVLIGLALFSVSMWFSGAGRAIGQLVYTHRTVRPLLDAAETVRIDGLAEPALLVDTDFPIVAVVGFLKPRLVIARSVLNVCPPDELRAIVAHERAHMSRHDNLRRLAFHSAPDVLGLTGLDRELRGAWHAATENSADDAADDAEKGGRLALAQALIRVARLTPPGPPRPLPISALSALYRGENLDQRVRRLLAPRAIATAPAPWWRVWSIGLGAVVVMGITLETIHQLVEVAVAYLP